MTKEQQHFTTVLEKKRSLQLAKLKKEYPTLYWAKSYHRNTRNEKMVFERSYYLLALYKAIERSPYMVVEKAVQIGLSELFIINSLREAYEGLTVMYVLPKYEIRNRFVSNRIDKLMRRVKVYAIALNQAGGASRTSLKHFGQGGVAYVGSNVESEFIEIPVDSAYVDEKDRCNQPNLLMLPDRLSASPYKYEREISNPTVDAYGIDARYLDSSMGVWMIKCPSCGEWFTPDFFKHVVKETSSSTYIVRDELWDGAAEIRPIHECGAAYDRLVAGEWVHAHPDKQWKGFRASKMFSKHTELTKLTAKWMGSVGNMLMTQVFYNSDLGLPLTQKGAKITIADLEACKRSYRWPVKKMPPKKVRVMGVDIGAHLNVIIRERVVDGGMQALKLLLVAEIPSFRILIELIKSWKPKIVVVDAQPEIHEVMSLKGELKNVISCRFQADLTKITYMKPSRELTIDRTAALDAVQQAVDHQMLLLPMQADSIAGYYNHMTCSTRILEPNEKQPDKSRYVWVHTLPDHYFLAEAYCLLADTILPSGTAFDFYARQVGQLTKEDQPTLEDHEIKIKHAKLPEVTPVSFEEFSHLTPDSFLRRIDKGTGLVPNISSVMESLQKTKKKK